MIKEKILQRRKQMIVHSSIYYILGQSIISDQQFDKWAYELVDLQKQYPKESKEVWGYEYFHDWDGTTGYHLPISNVQALADAKYLLKLHDKYGKQEDC